MPADVFRALDDIEYGFMRERVEAEFSSAHIPPCFFCTAWTRPLTSPAEFNETQTTKRSAYRKKVAASKKGTKGSDEGGADTSMAGTDADTTMAGGDTSFAGSTAGGQHRAKKARTDGGGDGDSRMDVDDEMNDASDPESVPNEDDDEEPQDEEEEEQDVGDNEEDQDELEEREDRPDEDEALDDGNNSD